MPTEKLTDRYRPHKRVQLDFSDTHSLTKQSMRDECNINLIMKKFEKNGLLDHLNTHQGNYGDFITFQSYHDSMNQVLEAQETFMTLPSKVREQFANDPSLFLKFAQNPNNYDQMVEMGLANKRPLEAPEPPKKIKGASPPPSEEASSDDNPST